jgi:uncharacterized protein YjeT (DUF2065 family)
MNLREKHCRIAGLITLFAGMVTLSFFSDAYPDRCLRELGILIVAMAVFLDQKAHIVSLKNAVGALRVQLTEVNSRGA